MIYLSDNDPTACAVLREMMAAGLIAGGVVDDRSIAAVSGRGLDRYDRVHLFAGIGGFELAARLAGWPDGLVLWTGGFPCQPFSAAGRKGGTGDDRYLWPEFHRLLRVGRPEFVLVENVPGIDGAADLVLDRVCSDLEGLGYEVWPAEIPACAVDAAHLRNRVWIVGHRAEFRRQGLQQVGSGAEAGPDCGRMLEPSRIHGGAVEHGPGVGRRQGRSGADVRGGRDATAGASAVDVGWISCHDGKFRRVPLGLLDPAGVLADVLPGRRVALHGLGNAIVPQVAAGLMTAMLEAAGYF